ncbi:MAG: matrixin family metalloprotease [Byssovorax sp.]
MIKLSALGPLALATLLLSSSSSAFTEKSTAGGSKVRFSVSAVSVFVDPSLSAIAPGALAAATQAFAAWNAARDTSAPLVTVREGPADDIGYHPGSENRCTIRYVEGGYPPAGKALAITYLTFDGGGRILDADIIVNGGPSRPFSIDPQAGSPDYDLQSVLTHEAGHVFGLDENTQDPEVTMYFETGRAETQKRDLAPDDEAGLRDLYPETFDVAAGCAMSPAGGSPAWGAMSAAVGVMLIGIRRRARR